MSRVIKTRVCIGGPADGKRWAAEDGVRDIRMSDERGDVTSYREERVAGQDVVFSFWRWEKLPIDEALSQLFAEYTPPAPTRL